MEKDARLALEFALETVTPVLAKIAESTHADPAEKCLMVWETLVNVGDRDIPRYKTWNNSQCVNFDARKAQENIAIELIEEFGATSVM